jgi:hypothetical protein
MSTLKCKRTYLSTSRRSVPNSTCVGDALEDFWSRMKEEIFAMSQAPIDEVIDNHGKLLCLKGHLVDSSCLV